MFDSSSSSSSVRTARLSDPIIAAVMVAATEKATPRAPPMRAVTFTSSFPEHDDLPTLLPATVGVRPRSTSLDGPAILTASFLFSGRVVGRLITT